MRLFAIPILKNKWAYYCHSTIPTTSRLTQVVDWSSKKWDQLGQAEQETWKRKLYDRGTNLMNQLDYEEWFFKSVPPKEDIEKPLNMVLIHHPSILQGDMLNADLQGLLKRRTVYHRKYMYYSAYWVPISCTFVIVPLIPNIPLAYNLFRLYSHYKAYKGAQHLQSLADYGSLEYKEDPQMDALLGHIQFKSSQDIVFSEKVHEAFLNSPKKPNLEHINDDVDGVLNSDDIQKLVKVLNVPGLELELTRARSQILKSIAHQRFGGVDKEK
ncbi:hypothetical protein K501DRAFT_258506 [Backusella circina FSU 941]|nr:hypothetical protein K501DRAFT_258506 [Backusella circina FSU 941]